MGAATGIKRATPVIVLGAALLVPALASCDSGTGNAMQSRKQGGSPSPGSSSASSPALAPGAASKTPQESGTKIVGRMQIRSGSCVILQEKGSQEVFELATPKENQGLPGEKLAQKYDQLTFHGHFGDQQGSCEQDLDVFAVKAIQIGKGEKASQKPGGAGMP